MDNNLFGAFPPMTRAQWEAVIKKELKDKDPSSLDVVVDGAVLSPFHVAEDGVPSGDRRRGVKRSGDPWRSTVGMDAGAANANKLALEALMGGADALEFYGKPHDLGALLKDVWVGAIDLSVDGDAGTLDALLAIHSHQGTSATDVSICLGLPHDADVSGLKDKITGNPRLRLFSVSDGGTRNTGDALEQGRALLSHLVDQGFTIDDACARLQFRLHLGDDLFVEAARLRAFREAWASVVDEFKPAHDCSHTTWIQAVVSYPAETKSAHENVIRATLQAISAITGGCDGLTIPPPPLPEGDVLARRVVAQHPQPSAR